MHFFRVKNAQEKIKKTAVETVSIGEIRYLWSVNMNYGLWLEMKEWDWGV